MNVSESTDTAVLLHTVEITNALLSAISTTDPIHSLASRIGVLCQGTAIIYDFDGNIVASTGAAPTQLIWHEASSTNQIDLIFDIGRWHVRTRRVSLRDGVHTIAIASREPETIERVGDLLLDVSERLLSAVHGIQYGAARRDRRENEQLLAALHDGVLPAREHRFWNRMTQFGFAAYGSVRAAELAPIACEQADDAGLDQLFAHARTTGTPLLAMVHRTGRDAPATISALVPDSPAGEQWLRDASSHYLVGVSSSFDTLCHVPDNVREAETGLGISREWARAADDPAALGPIWIDRIDLATWLLSHVDQRQLKRRIAETLTPLDPDLRETLITFLACEQNINRTASELFVHPNTVRYRLNRVSEALGMPVQSAPALANLVLALRPDIAAAQLQVSRSATPDP